MKRLPPLSLIFLLLLGLGLTWVLHSSAALRWGFSLASENLPLTLEADFLDGSLAGPMQARGLKIVTGDISITARDLELDWWAGDLLRGRVNLKRLVTRELVINNLGSTDTAPPAKSERVPIAVPELPVGLYLNKLQIEGLSFVSGENTVRVLEHFRGAARWDSRGINISVDVLQREDVALNKSWLQIEAGLPHKLSGSLDWRIPGLLSSELLGQSTLDGNLAQPRTLNTLLQPAPATLELNADLGQATLLLSGTLDAKELRLSALQEGWPDKLLSTHTDFSIDGRAISTQGALQWDDLPSVDITLKSLVETDHIQVLAMDIREQGSTGIVQATGTVPLSAQGNFQLHARWEDLDLDMSGKRLRSAGKADMSGTVSDYVLQLSTDSQLDDYPGISFQASAAGSEKGLVIPNFVADLMNGKASGNAELDWKDGLLAKARIKARGLDTSTLEASLPGQIPNGKLDMEADVELGMSESGTRLAVVLEKLGGEIEEEPLAGHGALTITPEQFILDDLELQLGGGVINASGTLSENMDFDVDVKQMEIAHWIPELGGTLAAQLDLSGPVKTPKLEGFVSARQPTFGQWRGDLIDAQLSVNLAARDSSSVLIQAKGLHNAEHFLGDLEIKADGVAENHVVTLQLAGGEQALQAELLGGYQADQGWNGQISTIQLTPDTRSPAPWNLTSSAPLVIGATGYHLEQMCLGQGTALACLSGNLEHGAGDVNLTARQVPLANLNPFLGNNLDLTGLLGGEIQGQFNERGELTGQARLELGESSVNWIRSDGETTTLAISRARLDGKADQEGLGVKATLELGGNDAIALALNMQRDAGPAADWPAEGWISLDLEDLARYDTMVPELEGLTGKLSSRIDLTGSLGDPMTSGHLSLEKMETFLPELGTRISGVSVNLQNSNQKTQLSARATIGGGQVALDGDVALLQGEPRASLHLTGEGLTLVDSSKLYLQASPDLTLALSGDEVNITGRLHVPLARIRPVDLGGAVRSSPDAVVLNTQGQRESRGRFKVTTDVVLELGNRVKFDGYGLTANITGFLALRDVPGKITTGRGELNVVGGKYKLYGMELDIERGQLLFAGGPIDTPGLSIRAARETDNVRVGVDVGGTLLEPTMTMFSTPSMPQSEIVAYLLTGKPMADLDSASGQKASAAGDALALAGGSLLTGEIGSRVGLDEVTFASDADTGNEELVLGKHLSPDLYVSYGIGLYEAINTLRIRYQLNERLSIRSESGVSKSVDLFWSAER